MSSIFNEAIKNFLAPIQEFLNDESISEIMINGSKEIFVEKQGKIFKTQRTFRDEEDLLSAVRAIAQSVGRSIGPDQPRLDAYLSDGSRIAVVLAPLARKGTTVAIRKFSKTKLTLKELVEREAISKDAARFLDICVYLGKNILVSGGTGSGKTTILNILASRIPKGQRVMTIEDSLELQIDHDHWVSFVTRKKEQYANLEPVSMRDLVHSAMRLRPDRLIIGEVRGEEATDLLQVMNTGHHGSMGTIHANSAVDACTRLEMLSLLNGSTLPFQLIRQLIGSAIQIVIHCDRMSDGRRRITEILELQGLTEQGQYRFNPLFEWVQQSRDDQGNLVGQMVTLGQLPSFMSLIEANRLPLGRDIFLQGSVKRAA